jgi:hypothetical protein
MNFYDSARILGAIPEQHEVWQETRYLDIGHYPEWVPTGATLTLTH